MKAAIKATESMTGLFSYEWKVATAFRKLLEMKISPGQLRDLVRIKANRYAQDDCGARVFIEKIYRINDLINAIDFNEYED